MLGDRGEEIDSQLLDTLYSFTDFQQFKELMLDHKKFCIQSGNSGKQDTKPGGSDMSADPAKNNEKKAGLDEGKSFG